MILGFTGTRRGVTGRQYTTLCALVERFAVDGISEAHHGDCVGADVEFQGAIRLLAASATVVIHPPDDPSFRANCRGDVVLPEKPYLVRNADIVVACDHLIAIPRETTEQQRGGTWSTIRKARKAGKPITIIWPDGSTTDEAGR